MLPVKIVNKSSNPLPDYGRTGNSGVDLRANLSSPITLGPLERRLIPTGLYFEIPLGYELHIRPRSGLAVKHGLDTMAGTVDSNYRGEVGVVLVNLSNVPFTVYHGDRIAQGVFGKVEEADFTEVLELSESTTRGEVGFGSSGIK